MPPQRSKPPVIPANAVPPTAKVFLSRLTDEVTRRFTKATGLVVVTFPLDWPCDGGEADPVQTPPTHPDCADKEDTTPCRESWEGAAARLREIPAVHWHQCPFGKWCVLVPIVFKGKCIAAGKLVGYLDLGEAEFAALVDHFEVIIHHFMRREAPWIAEQLGAADEFAREAVPGPAAVADVIPGGLARLEHIRLTVMQRLADPQLSVKTIAGEFGLDTAYLGHLFSVHFGEHLSCLIAARRMARAGELLVRTRLRIGAIAGSATPMPRLSVMLSMLIRV